MGISEKNMEFQAVVMAAGIGSRMREITSSIPKCLLPVGNTPLILCCLNILKRAGFSDAIVIVRENEKSKIQNSIEGKIDLKLDIVAVPKNEDWGTADSVRYIKDKIKMDLLVLSCDLISDINLQNMLAVHRSRGSSLTVLLFPFPASLKEVDMPGYKKKCKFERDIIGLDGNGRLIFINSEADFEEGVPFKLSILKQNPTISVFSNLMDAHLYIIKKDLVTFILNNGHISTLKGEFLPAVVKKQFTSKKQNLKSEPGDVSLGATVQKNWLDIKKLSLEHSSWKDHSCYGKSAIDEVYRCFAFVEKESFCLRINTLIAYADANKKVLRNFTDVIGGQRNPHQFQKSQVDADSVIGDNSELLIKASVKQSSIGNNCKLNEKAKVSNSVIMENVELGKNCLIQNSIVCNNVKIEEVCTIKNCIIGPEQTVKASTKLNSEILQSSDHLMEI